MPKEPSSYETQHYIELLQSKIDSSKKAIQEFKEHLDVNLTDALEWADNAFLAAAQLEHDERLLLRFETVPVETLPLSPAVLDYLLESLDRFVSRRLGQSRISGSTSGSHRLMAQAQAQIAAQWYDTVSAFSRQSVRIALENMRPELPEPDIDAQYIHAQYIDFGEVGDILPFNIKLMDPHGEHVETGEMVRVKARGLLQMTNPLRLHARLFVTKNLQHA